MKWKCAACFCDFYNVIIYIPLLFLGELPMFSPIFKSKNHLFCRTSAFLFLLNTGLSPYFFTGNASRVTFCEKKEISEERDPALDLFPPTTETGFRRVDSVLNSSTSENTPLLRVGPSSKIPVSEGSERGLVEKFIPCEFCTTVSATAESVTSILVNNKGGIVYLYGVMESKKSLFLAKFIEEKIKEGKEYLLYSFGKFIVRNYTPKLEIKTKSFEDLDFKKEAEIWGSLDFILVDEGHFLTTEQLQFLYSGVSPMIAKGGTVIIVSLQSNFKNEEFPIFSFLIGKGVPSSEVRYIGEDLILSGNLKYDVAERKLCDLCEKNVATTHIKTLGNFDKILEEGHDLYSSVCYGCWEERNKKKIDSQVSAESPVAKFSQKNESTPFVLHANASPSPSPNGFSTPFIGESVTSSLSLSTILANSNTKS
jgi:thymidine kinase